MISTVKNIFSISFLVLIMSSCYHAVPTIPEIVPNTSALVFNDYDFNSGEYELFGIYWSDFERNSLADSIGTFSIKDTVLLNQLKVNWNLDADSVKECGYDYKLYLAKGDSVVSTSFLNIDCESILVDGVAYKFERDKIANLYGKTDSIVTLRIVFYGQGMAVDYLGGMRADSNIFVLDNGGYVWEKYIGYFEVTYTNKKVRNSKLALVEAQDEIRKKFVSEDFELKNVGANLELGTYKIRVYCDESFSKDFKLYPILKEYTYIINYSMTGFKRL